jgi:hypothetical protein
LDFRRIESAAIEERARVVFFRVENAFILLLTGAVPSLGPGQLDVVGFGRRMPVGFEQSPELRIERCDRGLLVKKEVGRPDPKEPPAQMLEDDVPHPVAIARRRRVMVARAIALDAR